MGGRRLVYGRNPRSRCSSRERRPTPDHLQPRPCHRSARGEHRRIPREQATQQTTAAGAPSQPRGRSKTSLERGQSLTQTGATNMEAVLAERAATLDIIGLEGTPRTAADQNTPGVATAVDRRPHLATGPRQAHAGDCCQAETRRCESSRRKPAAHSVSTANVVHGFHHGGAAPHIPTMGTQEEHGA